MLNQGVGINDYDIVSGFNLLHFAVKSASIAGITLDLKIQS